MAESTGSVNERSDVSRARSAQPDLPWRTGNRSAGVDLGAAGWPAGDLYMCEDGAILGRAGAGLRVPLFPGCEEISE